MRDGKVLTLIVGFGETGDTLVDVLKDAPFESEKKFFSAISIAGESEESLKDTNLAAEGSHNPPELLDDKIRKLLEDEDTQGFSTLNVYITGAIHDKDNMNFALQIPRDIRSILKKYRPELKYRFCGVFITSFVSKPSKLPTRDYKKFLMSPDYREIGETVYRNLYSDDTAISYDSIFFERHWELCDLLEKGILLPDLAKHLAGILYTILFIPVNEGDYHFLNTSQEQTENVKCKFYSVGLGIVDYPYSKIQEYTYLQCFDKKINNEWLYIHHLCSQAIHDALTRQRKDPSESIPSRRDIYIRVFEKEFAANESQNLVCKANGYLDSIDEEIYELLANDKIKETRERFSINEDFKRVDLDQRIQKAASDVDSYAATMKEYVRRHKSQVADRSFSPHTADLINLKEEPTSVYKLLTDKHPISARYLCYKIIKMLDERIEELSSSQDSRRNDIGSFESKISRLLDELHAAQNKKFLFVIPAGKRSLKGLFEEAKASVNTVLYTISKYSEAEIKEATYLILRKRFAQLADYYERLFDDLNERAHRNKEKLCNFNFEIEHSHRILMGYTVYNSPDAVKQIFHDASEKLTFSMFDNNVNEEIILGLSRLIELEYEYDNERFDDKLPHRSNADFREMIKSEFRAIGDDVVFRLLKNSINQEAGTLLSISIKEAIGKHMRLKGYYGSSDSFEKDRLKYENELIDSALLRTSPRVYAKKDEFPPERFYIALHPDSGEVTNGQFDLSKTEFSLLNTSSMRTPDNTTVIVDDRLSDKSIMCLVVRRICKETELKFFNDLAVD